MSSKEGLYVSKLGPQSKQWTGALLLGKTYLCKTLESGASLYSLVGVEDRMITDDRVVPRGLAYMKEI